VPEGSFAIEELDQRSFRLTGSLDVPSGGMLHELLDMLSRTEGDITLDMSGVTFMDSGGLRALIQACMDLGSKGELRVLNPNGQIRRLFDLTKVEGGCPNLRVLEA
jgi:anti-anti-sigma factor